MVKTLFTIVSSLALSLAVYLFFHLGLYKSVAIAQEKRGPMYLLFKNHMGPYHQIGPTIHEVELWASEHKIPCQVTFGEYIDDPDKVEEDRLRSHGGCVLSAPLTEKPPQFEYQEIPEREYIVGHFDGSPAVGPLKVYSKVKTYMSERRLKIPDSFMEIYKMDGPNVTTEYLYVMESP